MVHLSAARLDDGHFDTEEVRPGDKPCLSTSRLIALPKNHYKLPPKLAAGFSSLDVSCDAPIRANLVADNITTDTFRIAVETWGESILHSATSTWIEHKTDARDCVFGQFDTQDESTNFTMMANGRKGSLTKQPIRKNAAPKKYGKVIPFPRPFKEQPDVICWLNRVELNSGEDYNYKVRAFADKVTQSGFSAHLNTWDDDGSLPGAGMAWIAFPKNKAHVDSGTFSTTAVRRRTDPRPKTTGKVKFRRKFDKAPTVLAALNLIDAAGNADLRVRVNVDEVSREGFRWTLETWDDSTLYAAGAGWIALGFA